MTVLDVARKDFEDAIRSRAIWFAVGVFVVALALGVALPALVFDDPDAATLVTFMQSPATNLVLPVLAVMLGYRSIVGERERGSVTFLLGLPLSRRDVVLGKVVGRSAVLAIAIATGFLAVGVVVTAFFGRPPIGRLVAFALVTVLAGTSFVSIAVGVSATTSTGTRAISVLVGGLVLATSLWERIPPGLHYLLRGGFPGEEPPGWVQFLVQLNPIEAYGTASTIVLPDASGIQVRMDGAGVAADRGALVGVPDSPFYEPAFVLAILVGWIVVPVAIGYLRFRAADLP